MLLQSGNFCLYLVLVLVLKI
uniref:Uncharacterized protein n=1 Tax=Arundo donax TaxID=35708 RepID=A0A0A9DYN5_ARUDO